MKTVFIAALLGLALSGPAFAQDKAKAGTDGKAPAKSAKREPSEKQKAQQERMADCNEKAKDKKGDERRNFMSSCLKGSAPSAAQTAQQNKMKSCNTEASNKKLKGKERQTFMSDCLKG